MTEKKITYSEALAFVLESAELPENISERLVALKSQVDKKNASKSDKVDKAQREVMDKIIAALASADKPMTVTEIGKALDNEYSNQRLSSYVKKLVESAEVVRSEDKRKAYFALPSAE